MGLKVFGVELWWCFYIQVLCHCCMRFPWIWVNLVSSVRSISLSGHSRVSICLPSSTSTLIYLHLDRVRSRETTRSVDGTLVNCLGQVRLGERYLPFNEKYLWPFLIEEILVTRKGTLFFNPGIQIRTRTIHPHVEWFSYFSCVKSDEGISPSPLQPQDD